MKEKTMLAWVVLAVYLITVGFRIFLIWSSAEGLIVLPRYYGLGWLILFVVGQLLALLFSKFFYKFPARKLFLLVPIATFSIIASAMIYFCGEALVGLSTTMDLVPPSSNSLEIVRRLLWLTLNWAIWIAVFYSLFKEQQFVGFIRRVINTLLFIGLVTLVLTTFMLVPPIIKFGWGEFAFLAKAREVYWNQLGILHAMLWTFGIQIHLWFDDS